MGPTDARAYGRRRERTVQPPRHHLLLASLLSRSSLKLVCLPQCLLRPDPQDLTPVDLTVPKVLRTSPFLWTGQPAFHPKDQRRSS